MLMSVEPLNVLLAAWAPFHAGAEVAAERLAVGLQHAGHRMTVAIGTEGNTAARMREAGLSVRYVPLAMTDKKKWWKYRRGQIELRKLLAELAPDVIHANDLPTSQMVARAAARCGVPRVCHHRWIFGGSAIDWLNKFGAERHLFVSNALMEELCGASPKLASSPRAVVYDGLPLPPCPTADDRQNARQMLGLPLDRKVVLFAGQIIERKGVADLLRAWRVLKDEFADTADLVIVGDDLENDGCHRIQMEELAAALGCAVRFVGFQRDVARWLIAADVCVVPSHAEPLGNATLEAMACGRPVVGSRVGGIPEMIIDGETGLLTPPRDPAALAAAIKRLLTHPEMCRHLGDAARRRCERHFSIKAHVEAVVRQYQLAVASKAVLIA
jgi:glycosyltransferase involved in cell wall biosynthesis